VQTWYCDRGSGWDIFVKKMDAHEVSQIHPLAQFVSVFAGTYVHFVGVGVLDGFEGEGERFLHQACFGDVVYLRRNDGSLREVQGCTDSEGSELGDVEVIMGRSSAVSCSIGLCIIGKFCQ